MSPPLRFLFGTTRGGFVWRLVHYALLLPLWGFRAYFHDFKPGAGPQGGEAIFLLMVLYGMAVLVIALADTLYVLSARGLDGWRRFLAWPVLLLLVPAVSLFLGFAMSEAATDPDLTDGGRRNIALALAIIIPANLGLPLAALADVRRARERARTTA